ncbi:MAG: TorF family putative porin [Rudaea sp.]
MCRIPFVFLTLALTQSSFAQVSAQASIVSDYVYRGVSLTQGRPSATLEADIDDASGWFAGALVTGTRLYSEPHYEPEVILDVGYAHALTTGLTWEAGATYSYFSDFTFWNYAEVFAGVLGERWNARLYYATDYFGRDRRSWYGEINFTQPLDEHWRLLGHVGAVRSSKAALDSHSSVLDASVGVAAKFGSASFAIKRSVMNRDNYLYAPAASGERGTWVVSLAYSY